MTGYSKEDAIGKSCRFLQGPKSDEGSIATIRRAVQTGTQEVAVNETDPRGVLFVMRPPDLRAEPQREEYDL